MVLVKPCNSISNIIFFENFEGSICNFYWGQIENLRTKKKHNNEEI